MAPSAISRAFTAGMWKAVSSGLIASTSYAVTAPPASDSPKSYGTIGVSSSNSCIPVRGARTTAPKRARTSRLSRTW